MFSTKPSTQPLSIQTILNVIDDPQVNGIMFGSQTHLMLSKLNYIPNDVDILFYSTTHMQKFNELINLVSHAMKASYYHIRTFDQGYTFTENISMGTSNVLHAVFAPTSDNETCQSNEICRIHCSVLNLSESFTEQELDILTKRDCTTATLLAKKLAFQDFLANFYIDGKIYHKLTDLVNVTVKKDNKSKLMASVLNKYTWRGVKITMIEEQPAEGIISVTEMTSAKNYYRGIGLAVIPISPASVDGVGKTPAVTGWVNRTNAEDFVCKNDQNIGIVCGPNSGIVCIDVDVKDRGVEMFNKMLNIYGALPVGTAVQRSGNDGYHYIFKYNHSRMSEMNAKIKCPKLNGERIGIDMWIQKCQFVAYPSINYITMKQYTWITPITSVDALPDLPEWIYDLYHTENICDYGLILSPTVNAPQVILQSVEDASSDESSDELSEDSISSSSDGDTESECQTDYHFQMNIIRDIISKTQEVFIQMLERLTMIEYLIVLGAVTGMISCTFWIMLFLMATIFSIFIGFMLMVLLIFIAWKTF